MSLSLFSCLTVVGLGLLSTGLVHAATTATQNFVIYSPSGETPPSSPPWIQEGANGSFSFDYALIQNLPVDATVNIPVSSLQSFNLAGIATAVVRGVSPNPTANFSFGLSDLTSFSATILNHEASTPAGFIETYTFSFTTTPVPASNSNFGNIVQTVRYSYAIVGADFGAAGNIWNAVALTATAQNAGDLVLSTTATPEPATFGVVGIAGLALLGMARRRFGRRGKDPLI
jgi:hypothetical protein